MSTRNVFPGLLELSRVTGRMQPGELLVYQWLSRVLNEDDEVLIQPYLGGKYPDAVVLRSGIIYVIEIKDYFLDLYEITENDNWVTLDKRRLVSNPFIQVKSYAKQVRYLLASGASGYSEPERYHSVVKPWVVLTNANNEDVESLLDRSRSRSRQHDNYKIRPARGLESVTQAFEKQTVLQSMIADEKLPSQWIKQKNNDETLQQAVKIVWELLKRTLIAKSIDGIPYAFDREQRKWIEHRSTSFKIHGPAGSGKTSILIQRAATITTADEKTALIVHSTNTLGNLLMFKANEVMSSTYRVRIQQRWALLEQVVSPGYSHLSIVRGSQAWFESVYRLLEGLTNEELQSSNVEKFDAVLIDEVQDFSEADLRIIKGAFLKPDGHWYLFGDSEQNTTGQGLDDQRFPKTNIPGRWGQLSRAYRFNGEKATRLLKVHTALYPQSIHNREGLVQVGQKSLFDDYTIRLNLYTSDGELRKYIQKVVEWSFQKGQSIAVITDSRRLAQLVHWDLRIKCKAAIPMCPYCEQVGVHRVHAPQPDIAEPWDLPVDHLVWANRHKKTTNNEIQTYQSRAGVCDRYHSLAYGYGRVPTLSVGTVQLLKGWEYDVVVFVATGNLRRSELHDAQLWTAVSRGKRHVRIVLPHNSEYCKLLQDALGQQPSFVTPLSRK